MISHNKYIETDKYQYATLYFISSLSESVFRIERFQMITSTGKEMVPF